jgi:hypothetical protein
VDYWPEERPGRRRKLSAAEKRIREAARGIEAELQPEGERGFWDVVGSAFDEVRANRQKGTKP